MFSKKLDFLMKLTNTKNSTLAHALHIDPSIVSRYRTGKRQLPKNADFLEPLSFYFASQIKEPYQIKILSDLISNSWPENLPESSMIIKKYLIDNNNIDDSINTLINNFSNVTKTSSHEQIPDYNNHNPKEETPHNPYYYGNAGRRDAVLLFLKTVVKEKSKTLYLYSDENMAWLIENEAFALEWAMLMKKAIMQGSKIIIIHTISRSLNEMMDAFNKWLPLYMTGSIEPYFYPGVKDDIFKKTMFIAPDLMAITASSIESNTDSSLVHIIREPIALAAVKNEFDQYHKMCHKVVNILDFTNPSCESIFDRITQQNNAEILMHQGLTLATMPPEISSSIFKRSDAPSLADAFNQINSDFKSILNEHPITEIIKLPALDNFKGQLIAIDVYTNNEYKTLYYTKEELIIHLKYIANLNETNENYNLLVFQGIQENIILYCKQYTGAILIHKETKKLFYFDEPRMTSVFWNFLYSKTAFESNKTQKLLAAYINDLKQL